MGWLWRHRRIDRSGIKSAQQSVYYIYIYIGRCTCAKETQTRRIDRGRERRRYYNGAKLGRWVAGCVRKGKEYTEKRKKKNLGNLLVWFYLLLFIQRPLCACAKTIIFEEYNIGSVCFDEREKKKLNPWSSSKKLMKNSTWN